MAKNIKAFVDGIDGNSISVGEQTNWSVNIQVLDQEGARYAPATSGAVDFYTDKARTSTFLFSKEITLDGSDSSHGELIVGDEDTDFTAGSTIYGFIRVDDAGEISVARGLFTLNVY